MIGKKILNYEIKSLIGEGGMGNVYLGEHTSIGRKVAIKVLKPELANNQEIRNRFKNEASVMAKLQHSNLVGLIDYVDENEGLYLIMEYVEGKGLDEVLKELKQPMVIDRAKAIMKQILSGFAYAHQNGIIHRDVKPANILLTTDDKVKVLDFGIAKLVGDAEFNLTKTGTQVGTVYYMSPEQVKAKELDLRSDIYSLGVTFYELLTGSCPYKAMTSEYDVYDKIVKEPLKSLTSTMGGKYINEWNVIQKATEKNPSKRFQNCAEFESMLANVAAVHESKIVTADAQEEKREEKKKGIVWWYFVFGAAALAFLIFMFMPGNRDTEVNKALLAERLSDSLEMAETKITYSEEEANTPKKQSSTDSPKNNNRTKKDAELDVAEQAKQGSYDDISKQAMEGGADNDISDFPDVEAVFIGGSTALQKWIASNVRYPEESIEMNEQGRVYLSFVVEPDGSITNIQVERAVSDNLDKEAKRLIRSMPKWVPGSVAGKKVRTRCRFPINFTLD